MLRILIIICGWRDIQARIHDVSLKLTIEGNHVWQMVERLTIDESFDTMYHKLQTPSPILKFHIKSLENFLDENLNFIKTVEYFISVIWQRR
jgi:hypothetical protein